MRKLSKFHECYWGDVLPGLALRMCKHPRSDGGLGLANCRRCRRFAPWRDCHIEVLEGLISRVKLKLRKLKKGKVPMLTLDDFKAIDVTCPVCGRPARIYEHKGESFLRCTWSDCASNPEGVPSVAAFCRVVAEYEAKWEALEP